MVTDISAGAARVPPTSRQARTGDTRTLLLRTAERLYASRGISEVSNRQVAEAAGQANPSAVSYHIGSKTDLLRAIAIDHAGDIARRMAENSSALRSADPRDPLSCLVRAYTEHLASLERPSWVARFTAQTTSDPAHGMRPLAEPVLEPWLAQAFTAMRSTSPLPDEIATLREYMVRLMVVHTCAEQERTAADSGVDADWALVGDTLVDSAVAVYCGQNSPPRRTPGVTTPSACEPRPERSL